MNNKVQAGLLLIFLTFLGVLGYNAWLLETTPPERTYTDFLSTLKNDQVLSVQIKGSEMRGEDRDGQQFRTFSPDIPSVLPVMQLSTNTTDGPYSIFSIERILYAPLLDNPLLICGYMREIAVTNGKPRESTNMSPCSNKLNEP